MARLRGLVSLVEINDINSIRSTYRCMFRALANRFSRAPAAKSITA